MKFSAIPTKDVVEGDRIITAIDSDEALDVLIRGEYALEDFQVMVYAIIEICAAMSSLKPIEFVAPVVRLFYDQDLKQEERILQ